MQNNLTGNLTINNLYYILKLIRTILVMKKIMNEMAINFYPKNGTLLGLLRNGFPIPINEDVDLRTAGSTDYTFFVSGISSKTSNAVYFHDDFFEDKELVFKSIIQDTGIRNIDVDFNYYLTNYSNVTYDETFAEKTAVANTRYQANGTRDSSLYMETGYGNSYRTDIETTFVFAESRLDLIVDTVTYQELVDYFTLDAFKYRIILNVYDRFDGEKLLNNIDHNQYIVYYPALTQNTQGSSFGGINTSCWPTATTLC